jgi:hypothetical protein
MPEVDHDWDNLIPKYKPQTSLFDKIVLSFVFFTIALSTLLMLLGLFNPQYFMCS